MLNVEWDNTCQGDLIQLHPLSGGHAFAEVSEEIGRNNRAVVEPLRLQCCFLAGVGLSNYTVPQANISSLAHTGLRRELDNILLKCACSAPTETPSLPLKQRGVWNLTGSWQRHGPFGIVPLPVAPRPGPVATLSQGPSAAEMPCLFETGDDIVLLSSGVCTCVYVCVSVLETPQAQLSYSWETHWRSGVMFPAPSWG